MKVFQFLVGFVFDDTTEKQQVLTQDVVRMVNYGAENLAQFKHKIHSLSVVEVTSKELDGTDTTV